MALSEDRLQRLARPASLLVTFALCTVSILDPEAAARSLDVPPDWKLIAYLCIGYPQDEDITPELARVKWQAPIDEARSVYRR